MHDVDEGVAVKGVRLLGLLVDKGHLESDEVCAHVCAAPSSI